ncbi:MAG: hypothetical protein LUD17_04190, partial [Bacteroidales bacterium]|nr:hypothetical protein [Bacteroidales bacterium]
AFVGDECRGIGSRNSDGSYSINVLGFEDEEALITFRYYSAELATVFSSRNSVEFSTEYSYGGAGYAATPDFTMSGKYPVLMTAVVSVDNSTIQPSGDDQVAAFVGDECRGVGSLYAVDGSTYIFQLYVYGLSEDETVTLYYYSAKTGTLYADNKHIRNLANNEEWGTYLVPIELTLEPVNAISFYLCLPEELKTYASASDQMAAFVGENCCGVGEFGADGIWRLSANAATADQIELRYYNSDLGYLFTDTKAYAYAVDSAIGSEAAPHTLDFGLDSLHPLTMRAYFSLPSWLSAVTSYNDMMAAFVDGECRGVATVRHTSLGYIFVIDIHGSLSGSETVTIRYYSSDLQSVYVSHRQFTFSASATIGTETAPEELILTKK